MWEKMTFEQDKPIVWPCPTCHSTALQLDPENLKTLETKETHDYKKDEDFEWSFTQFRFVGFLQCRACNESVSMQGSCHLEERWEYNYYEDHPIKTYVEIYEPVYFIPAMKLITIPGTCPDNIKSSVVQSFYLFFSDLDACVNRIRTTIELILNSKKVRKTSPKSRKTKLTLHNRIIEFGKNNPDIANYLLAMKWIGNSGSHESEVLTRTDILEVYELLEKALQLLYTDTEKRLQKISKEIIARKGVRKRTKTT